MTLLPHSLYTRLALQMLLILGASAIGLVVASDLFARQAVDAAYDRLLVGSAMQLAEGTWEQNGAVMVDPPSAVFSMLSAHDRLYFTVFDTHGEAVAGNASLPVQTRATQLQRGPMVFDASFGEQAVRIAVVGRKMTGSIGDSGNGWLVFAVAQTLDDRSALARSVTIEDLFLICILFAFVLTATLLAVQIGIRPLSDIETVLREREPTSLHPLKIDAPAEVMTLVRSINEFMQRLSERIALMERVIGDAAHQIRTPVTALTAQVDLLAQEPGESKRRQHLVRVQERTAQLGRLVNQLLNHAMVIHRADTVRFEPIDLRAIARRVLTDCATLPMAEPFDFGLDAPECPVPVQGDGVALREAVANLVGNAIAHGARTLVHVRVGIEGKQPVIEVSDDGPGIPRADWQRVREPFHARDGARPGAGLGLAIAEAVILSHGGSMAFRHETGENFAVLLLFPQARPG